MLNKKKLHISSYKKHKSKGMSMIVAIVLMMVLIVFTFSLTLVAYTLYSSQAKNVASMRCSEAANTLSKSLEQELMFSSEQANRFPEDSYLYDYIRYNICQDDVTWPYYAGENVQDHDRAAACRYFDLTYNNKKTVYDEEGNPKKKKDEDGQDTDQDETVSSVEGLPGRTEVCIYWMLPEKSEITDYSGIVGKDYMSSSRDGIRLFIEVTCESGGQSYTVTREYELETDYYGADRYSVSRCNYLRSLYNDSSVNPTNRSLSDINMSADEDNVEDCELWIWKETEY